MEINKLDSLPVAPSLPPERIKFPSFFGLLGETIDVWKSLFWKIMALYAIFFGIACGLAILSVVTLAVISRDMALVGFIIFILLFAVSIASGFMINISEIYLIKNRQNDIGVRDALGYGWNRALGYFGTIFLAGLISFLGYVCFIVPGILFSIWFSLAPMIAADQGIYGLEALKTSRRYMKNNIGGVLLWTFLFGVLASLVGFILSAIGIIPFLGALFGTMVQFFVIVPISLCFPYLLYERIRDIKESGKEFDKNNYWIWAIISFVLLALFIIFIFACIVAIGMAVQKINSQTFFALKLFC